MIRLQARTAAWCAYVLGLLVLLACLPGPASRGQTGRTAPANNLVYQVFVRSFCSSDSEYHPAGDLKGLTTKLDSYLNDGDPATTHDLEVGILWLMPIFPSPSYHGYDVTDYRAINPDYGTMDDFKTLLQEAHRRGVRVILDAPFNHTSDRHPWFKEAVKDRDSPYRRYYHFRPDEVLRPDGWHAVQGPGGERLRYFGLFSPQMPDLDFDNPKVRDEIKDVARFWLDLGVDGFRLDAAKHIYGDRFDQLKDAEVRANNTWWHEFSAFVYQHRPDAVLIGEVIDAPEMLVRHARGLDALLDEPFLNDVRDQVSHPKPGFVGRYAEFLKRARQANREGHRSPPRIEGHPFQPFDYVASHDKNPRLASDLEQRKRRGMAPSVDAAYRLALGTLLTLSSHPILYQGDEVMQCGWKWNGNPPNAPRDPGDGSAIHDETLREPFPWYRSGKGKGQTSWFAPRFDRPGDGVSAEEQGKEGGMLHLTRGLTRLRARHPALANGDLGAIPSDSAEWMVFEKVAGQDRYLVLTNLTGHDLDYKFHAGWYQRYVGAQQVFWSDGKRKAWKDVTDENRTITDVVAVPAYGLAVLRAVNDRR
jgi:glycosidase